MNYKFEFDRLEGDWIIQSTNYSLLNNKLFTYIDQINWKKIQNKNNIIKPILKQIIQEYSITNYSIYITKSKNRNQINNFYKIFLHNNTINKVYILKLDYLGNIINKAFFKENNSQSLSINYKNGPFYITEITYLINYNLKIVKSLIKKNQKCIGISFSSEIKINS
uniref:putative single-stranded DNA binding protein n=1 Tax=Synarthrophyton patena TaxID=48972 RepID=UPI0021821BE8|nr:putative single-stranded DNA binding protein [Synarthrophyton patena]UVF62966.1 putative single-stranded DNA binding protein [Synarthrophyton patena]